MIVHQHITPTGIMSGAVDGGLERLIEKEVKTLNEDISVFVRILQDLRCDTFSSKDFVERNKACSDKAWEIFDQLFQERSVPEMKLVTAHLSDRILAYEKMLGNRR